MRENQLCTLDIQIDRPRSVSPLGIARCREFISDLGRRFSRKSHDGVILKDVENNRDFRQKTMPLQESRKDDFNSNLELHRLSSEESNSSDCENTNFQCQHRQRRSSSAARTARKDLIMHPQSSQSQLSSMGSESTKKAQTTQKKILRQPVSYTYLKGMSGLPTQRVPRSIVCSQYPCRRRFLV